MIHTDVLIVGAGPAGLSAAIAAGEAGAQVLVLDRSHVAGGQLVKQTHMFFGSEKQYAAYRGFEISNILLDKINKMNNVNVLLNATVLAAYDDGIWTAEINEKYEKIMPKSVVVASGASEKSLTFPGNDIPGVYGAGAVQTLMNQYGILPAKKVVMLGAGNIGLIVSYQLMQAGVEVLCVAEGSPNIGGYLVHASKLRRMGVPIYTRHSVKEASGKDALESVTIWALDAQWQGIPGTEKTFDADTLCISVGLSPLSELLWQAGCEMVFVPALGGHVPRRDAHLRTSLPGVFVAGDVAGVEEASSAMVGGTLAGLGAAEYLGYAIKNLDAQRADCLAQLDSLRHGLVGERIKEGAEKAQLKNNAKTMPVVPNSVPIKKTNPDAKNESPHAVVTNNTNNVFDVEMTLENSGIPTAAQVDAVFPSDARLAQGAVAVIECFKEIPCNPCEHSCNRDAIQAFEDIVDRPKIIDAHCNGCSLCLMKCPGLAIMVVDMTYSETHALIKLPYEMTPLPKKGDIVRALDRAGNDVCDAEVVSVVMPKSKTAVVGIAVDKPLVKIVRNIRCGAKIDTNNINNPNDIQPALCCDDKNTDSCSGKISADANILCRCSDLTVQDIRNLIKEGYTSVDELKRISRLGMGPCQGRTCTPLVMRELSIQLGVPMDHVSPGTFRPMVKSMKLGQIAEYAHTHQYDENGREADGGEQHA